MKKFIFIVSILASFGANAGNKCAIIVSKGSFLTKKIISVTPINGEVKDLLIASINDPEEEEVVSRLFVSAKTTCSEKDCSIAGNFYERKGEDQAQMLFIVKAGEAQSADLVDGTLLTVSCKE